MLTNAQTDADRAPIGKGDPPKKVDSKFFISLGIGLAVQAAGIVWWASNLQSAVQHNDFQIQMIARDVEKHAIFVTRLACGQMGERKSPRRRKAEFKNFDAGVGYG